MNSSLCFKKRETLFSEMQPHSIAILPGAVPSIRSNDTDYPFRQDSNFYYLTHFPEAHAIALLCKTATQKKYILFNQKKDFSNERWTGEIIGQDQAISEYGADEAYDCHDFFKILQNYTSNLKHLYLPLFRCATFSQKVILQIKKHYKKSRNDPFSLQTVHDIDPLIHHMRLFKDDSEIQKMRKAAEISAQAHQIAMQCCQPGMKEYELESYMRHHYLLNNCPSVAYNSIVGGGKNTCTLHYTTNKDTLKDGDLVLIDAAAEYENYAADITRTFPVNGRFSKEQSAIYQIVLEAQKAGIAQAKVKSAWNHIEEAILPIITQGLLDIGLLQGSFTELMQTQAYKKFYWHSAGHFLGLDVHDVGDYKKNGVLRTLEAGMVLTVEPGLYIPAHTSHVPEEWWNIGIRIEDDVLITSKGHEILSASAPKEIPEIEHLMKKN